MLIKRLKPFSKDVTEAKAPRPGMKLWGVTMKKISKPLIFSTVILSLFLSVFVNNLLAAPVSIESAQQVALNWMDEKTRRTYEMNEVSEVYIKKLKDEQVYYVFNIRGKGWVIVAADDVVYPIICYSRKGSYSEKEHPPAFDVWMNNVSKDIYGAITARLSPITKVTEAWSRLDAPKEDFRTDTTYSRQDIEPLLETIWNQREFYNESCPSDTSGPSYAGGHAVAGCVAVAMAQVLKYHNYPTTGIGSHSYVPKDHPEYGTQSADFSSTTYDWAAMPTAISTSNNAIATLIYHCGVSVDMNYGPSSSSATLWYTSNANSVSALKNYFKYEESLYSDSKSNYTDEAWKSLLKEELDANRPIPYRGTGHAFVCDGYEGTDYFHFNWGWGGSYDGYFYLDALTPGSHDYTPDQRAIFGVKPAGPVQELTIPYKEGFESGIPENWITCCKRVSVSTQEYHSGTSSLLLGSLDGTGTNCSTAILKMRVPENGYYLTFWVKRGYYSASTYNTHSVLIRPEFGTEVLHTVFSDGLNDDEWQQFTVDLTPWANTTVSLYFEQLNRSSSRAQWMYIDDVEIVAPEVIYVSGDGDCGGKTPCHDAIQKAIDDAPTEWTILVRQGTYAESLSLGNAKTLLIKGGYNQAYDQQTANTTFIELPGQTTLKTSNGSLKFQMISVR